MTIRAASQKRKLKSTQNKHKVLLIRLTKKLRISVGKRPSNNSPILKIRAAKTKIGHELIALD